MVRQLIAVACLALGCYFLGRLHGAARAVPTSNAEVHENLEQMESLMEVMQRELSAVRSAALAANNMSGFDEGLLEAIHAQEHLSEHGHEKAPGIAAGAAPPAPLREIVALDVGSCLDFNPSLPGRFLGMWACHRGVCSFCSYLYFVRW
jgi:hypothetical protein